MRSHDAARGCTLVLSWLSCPTVATNAKTGKGLGALGVLLDPEGPAIERIRRGEAYYGESFAYIAGYEPIRDASGKLIGICATGYVRP